MPQCVGVAVHAHDMPGSHWDMRRSKSWAMYVKDEAKKERRSIQS